MKKTKKQEIFEAAALLFKEKGYQVASMRDLANKVQLKASSLYSHIGSKEEILRKICFDNATCFVQKMEELQNQDISPKEKVRQLIHFHIQIATQDTTSVTVFNDEWRNLSEPHLSQFLNMRNTYEKQFESIIKEGIAQKQFKNVNSKVALFTILTSIRWIHYWYKPKRSVSLKTVEQDILTILGLGLEA